MRGPVRPAWVLARCVSTGGQGERVGCALKGGSAIDVREANEGTAQLFEQPAQRSAGCLPRCLHGAAPASASRVLLRVRRSPCPARPCAWRAPRSSSCRCSISALAATSCRRPMSGPWTRRTSPSLTTCPCRCPRSALRRTPGAWSLPNVRPSRCCDATSAKPPRQLLTCRCSWSDCREVFEEDRPGLRGARGKV